MLDHLALQVSDVGASRDFYLSLLSALGIREAMRYERPDGLVVDAVHEAASQTGADVLHAPRVWPEYHPGYYGVFARDLDGNNIEAVHHTFPAS